MMLRQRQHRHAVPHRRRGTLYVGVMMTALVVAVIGLGSLSVSHLSLRSAQNARDAESAAQLARTAVELGIRQLNSNSFWRFSTSNNVDYSPSANALNGGTFSYRFVDLDGNFLNNNSDGIRVYGTGRCGAATYVESVLLQPSTGGAFCLEAALHCHGSIILESHCNVVTSQFLSSNGSIGATASYCEIAGNVQAAGAANGSITGSRSTGRLQRQMPGNTAFEYYRVNGTWIDITTIPLSSNVRTVSNRVFAPTINPFGSAGNAEGIYVIDCQGQNLYIENSRIYGTLLIVNPGATCCFRGSLSHNPVSPNFPAVMVQGDAQFDTSWSPLVESAQTTNFNPTGAPYEDAVDTDTVDQYPSIIKGLTYVSGKLKIKANLAAECAFDGSVICGTIEFEGTGDARFTYRPTHMNYPPPGFARNGKLLVVPGTWQRSVLP